MTAVGRERQFAAVQHFESLWGDRILANDTSLLLSVRQVTDSLENVDLPELVDEIVALYPTQARSSKLTIEVDNRLESDGQWLGCPGYLTQILLNLINNAQTHAYPGDSPGSVQIILTTEMERYRIEVKDSGCGMSEENLDQVFAAFFTTKRGQGTTVTVDFPKRLK